MTDIENTKSKLKPMTATQEVMANPDAYAIRAYNSSIIQFHLNHKQMDRLKLSKATRLEIVAGHQRVQEIMHVMQNTPKTKVNELRQLVSDIRDVHFKLQALWGFQLLEEYHRYPKLPHCICHHTLGELSLIHPQCVLHGTDNNDPLAEI